MTGCNDARSSTVLYVPIRHDRYDTAAFSHVLLSSLAVFYVVYQTAVFYVVYQTAVFYVVYQTAVFYIVYQTALGTVFFKW